MWFTFFFNRSQTVDLTVSSSFKVGFKFDSNFEPIAGIFVLLNFLVTTKVFQKEDVCFFQIVEHTKKTFLNPKMRANYWMPLQVFYLKLLVLDLKKDKSLKKKGFTTV